MGHQFKALTNRSNMKLTLQPGSAKLITLQSELPVKGERFTATIRNQTCGAVARFVVTRSREDGSFAKANDLRIQEEPPGIKIVKQD